MLNAAKQFVFDFVFVLRNPRTSLVLTHNQMNNFVCVVEQFIQAITQ